MGHRSRLRLSSLRCRVPGDLSVLFLVSFLARVAPPLSQFGGGLVLAVAPVGLFRISPVVIFITLTAVPIRSAERFSPWGI